MEGIILVLGLLAGSFLNVVALSLPDWERILKGRSACPHCRRELKWFELIPLFSYLLQAGRCRSCGHKLTAQYWLVEVGTAALFLLTYLALAPLLPWYAWALVLVALSLWVVIFLHDARTTFVPMDVLAAAAVVTLVVQLLAGWSSLRSALLAAAILGLSLAVLRWLATKAAKREAMGSADAWVGAAVGLLVGWPRAAAALLLAFILGSIYGLVGAKLRGQSWRGAEVAFAPALLAGGVISLLWGDYLVSWYLGLL